MVYLKFLCDKRQALIFYRLRIKLLKLKYLISRELEFICLRFTSKREIFVEIEVIVFNYVFNVVKQKVFVLIQLLL